MRRILRFEVARYMKEQQSWNQSFGLKMSGKEDMVTTGVLNSVTTEVLRRP